MSDEQGKLDPDIAPACTCDRDEKNPAVIREFAADCPIHAEEVEDEEG